MGAVPREALATLELELLAVVNGLVWDLNLDPLQEQYVYMCSYLLSHLSSPARIGFFLNVIL